MTGEIEFQRLAPELIDFRTDSFHFALVSFLSLLGFSDNKNASNRCHTKTVKNIRQCLKKEKKQTIEFENASLQNIY